MKKTILFFLLLPTFCYAEGNTEQISREVSLSSDFSEKVMQDYLTISLRYETTNLNSKSLQNDINKKINDTKNILLQKYGDNNFKFKVEQISIQPNYEKGKITNWNGYAVINISGQNIQTLSEASTIPKDFLISNFVFSVSDEKIKDIKKEVVDRAIQQFKEDSNNITKSFGYNSYDIKSVSVNYTNQNNSRPYVFNTMMLADTPSAKQSEPADLSPDTTNISATINGVIIMNK